MLHKQSENKPCGAGNVVPLILIIHLWMLCFQICNSMVERIGNEWVQLSHSDDQYDFRLGRLRGQCSTHFHLYQSHLALRGGHAHPVPPLGLGKCDCVLDLGGFAIKKDQDLHHHPSLDHCRSVCHFHTHSNGGKSNCRDYICLIIMENVKLTDV